MLFLQFVVHPRPERCRKKTAKCWPSWSDNDEAQGEGSQTNRRNCAPRAEYIAPTLKKGTTKSSCRLFSFKQAEDSKPHVRLVLLPPPSQVQLAFLWGACCHPWGDTTQTRAKQKQSAQHSSLTDVLVPRRPLRLVSWMPSTRLTSSTRQNPHRRRVCAHRLP